MFAVRALRIVVPQQASPTVIVAVMLVLAIASGAAVALSPTAVLVGTLALGALISVTSSSARFVLVLAGGLVVFGSSDRLDGSKMVYLAWVVVCAGIAFGALDWRRGHGDSSVDVRPLLLGSAAVLGAVAISIAVASMADIPVAASLRDAAPYGLLAIAPLLGADCARSRLGKHIDVLIVVVGIAASAGFAVQFLGRRGIVELPFETLGFASVHLAALTFAVAVAAVLCGQPRRLLWAVIAASVLTLLLMTGTRSALVLLIGPVAMVVAHGKRLTRVVRLAGGMIAVGLGILISALVAAQLAWFDLAAVMARFESIANLSSDLTSDPSFIERSASVTAVVAAFSSSPLFGVGLGHEYQWIRFGGTAVSAFTIDTGLDLIAKFGMVGLALLGIGTVVAVRFYWRIRAQLPENIRLSIVGYSAISIGTIPLGNPLSDKGFGLGAALVVAWILASQRGRGEPMMRAAGGRRLARQGLPRRLPQCDVRSLSPKGGTFPRPPLAETGRDEFIPPEIR